MGERGIENLNARNLISSRQIQSTVPGDTIPPPDRGEQIPNDWVEYQDEFRIHFYIWNDPTTMKLVDFAVTIHIDRGPQFDEGPPVASADCSNHGSCHMHNETSKTKREQRVEVLELSSRDDLEIAFSKVVEELVAFSRMILKDGRQSNDYRIK